MFLSPRKINLTEAVCRIPLVAVVTMILVTIIFLSAMKCGLLINTTTSMPIGLYVKSNGAIHRGDSIAVCLPEPYKSQGIKHQYLGTGFKCGGSEPIIKEVLALPGDHVVLQDAIIKVNRRHFFYVTAYKDSQGEKLTVYPRGDYSNTKGYWLIGTNNIEHSWDSRYWGPIEKHELLYKIKPLLTW